LPLIVSLALLSGCTPNYSTFTNSHVQAGAWSGIVPGSFRYDDITLGTPKKPFDNAKPFSIKLSDGTVILSRDFSLARVKSFARRVPTTLDGWPAAATRYLFEGYYFVFTGRRLVSF